MRDALNSNPLVQAAIVGVLLVCVAIFVVFSGGGGESGEASGTGSSSASTTSVSPTEAAPTEAAPTEAAPGETAAPDLASALTAVSQAGAATPPLPRAVLRAYRANRTLVLLFVRDGGIDDDLTKRATAGVAGFPGVTLFTVPAHRISRYAAITEGVGIDRVPALVVVTPKRLHQAEPTASVSYGFQNAASVRQAVIDAGYKGPTVEYHP